MSRVLHVVSGDLWGGSEAQVEALLPELDTYGWEGVVLMFNEGDVLNKYRSSGINCILVDETEWNIAKFIDLCITAARDLRPRVVVTHGYKEAFVGAFISKQMGIPLVTQYHGSTENLKGFAGFKKNLYQRIDRSIISGYYADSIITVSQALSEELGFSKLEKLHVVHNIANFEHPPTPLQTLGEGLHIAMVGRLAPVKRVDLALQIMALLKELDAYLHIVGDGPLRSNLKKTAEDLGVTEQVVFHGHRSDALKIIQLSDALLIASDSEGIPTVMLEALADGVPVVSTDLAGVREVDEVLPERCAIRYFQRNDAITGARVLGEVLEDPQYKASAARIVPFVKDYFSPPRAAQQHAFIYSQLVGTKMVWLG